MCLYINICSCFYLYHHHLATPSNISPKSIRIILDRLIIFTFLFTKRDMVSHHTLQVWNSKVLIIKSLFRNLWCLIIYWHVYIFVFLLLFHRIVFIGLLPTDWLVFLLILCASCYFYFLFFFWGGGAICFSPVASRPLLTRLSFFHYLDFMQSYVCANKIK